MGLSSANNIKIVFWNVQGLAKKIELLHDYLSTFHIILLVETFTEEKNKNYIEKKLPKNYRWFWSYANRDKERGRPWGGQLIGVRKELNTSKPWEDNPNCCNGVDVEINGSTYNITNIYNRRGIKKIEKTVTDRMEENAEKKCIAFGDLNARIGVEGDCCISEDTDEKDRQRNTKDTVTNAEGLLLMDLLDDCGLMVLNGNKNGDWGGEITHVGYNSKSVIDYGTANELAWNSITEFRVGEQQLSDHFPLELTLSEEYKNESAPTHRWVQKFEPEDIRLYQKNLGKENISECREWSEMAERMSRAVVKKRIRVGKKANPWWNTDCYLARLETKREHKRAKKTNFFELYWLSRRKYKATIKRAKKIHQERTQQQLRSITNINDAWKFINHNRRSSCHPKLSPKPDELTAHFMQLLGGSTQAPEISQRDANQIPDPRATISKEEFDVQINRLKKGKAAGLDGMKPEMFKFADEATKERIRILMERCLQGQSIPAEWRQSRIHPLYKKGDPEAAENYRGLAIVNNGYKLYASTLTERLEKFVEDNNLLPDSQNGFRKERGTIDNVYILNHCVKTAISRGQHLYAAFIDFKAAFDGINRQKLWQKMRKLQIPEYIVQAIEEIYRCTPYQIGNTEFITSRGLKQGCPLSPILFAIYISDMDRVLRDWQSGGIRIGNITIFSLAYADDIVILATTPGELKDMLDCLYRYSTRRDMIINVAKSKVIKFSRGGIRSTQRWACGGAFLEEVRNFCYLGFTFQTSGRFSEHIKKLTSQGKRRVSLVWSIGELKFPNSFQIRKQMFTSLVLPTFIYGCELFGYEEHVALERVQRMYLRWTLGLAPWTKILTLRNETDTLPIHTVTAKRAFGYESRARVSPCLLLRTCLEDSLTGLTERSVAKARLLNTAGFSRETFGDLERRGLPAAAMVLQRKIDQAWQLQRGAAHASGIGTVNRLPWYLQQGREIKLVARFRLMNECRAMQSWRKERQCRVCRREDETLAHVLSCCGLAATPDMVLAEDGSGAALMRKIKQWRASYNSN